MNLIELLIKRKFFLKHALQRGLKNTWVLFAFEPKLNSETVILHLVLLELNSHFNTHQTIFSVQDNRRSEIICLLALD